VDRSKRNLLLGGALLGALAIGGLLPTMCAKLQIDRKPRMPRRVPPKRPPGTPKPALQEDIAPVLARLDRWYAAHLSPAQYKFNPPATDAQIDTFERLVGVKLPSSYRQLYRWHNGEDEDRWGHIYGIPLLSLNHAAYEWKGWYEVLSQTFRRDRYAIPADSWPKGAVDPAYINLRWIPLTADGAGNSIGIDMDPWPGGRVGQIILFGRDEDVKVVLAESLGKFLEWIAGLLEGGNFRLELDPGEVALRQFALKTPRTGDFYDGARELLGAPGPFDVGKF
jgi:cell wall assembly regulator SMI1